MRRLAALLLTFLAAVPARADTLVENVEGITLDTQGRVQRFSAMLIDDNGRIEQLFQRSDKRLGRADYRLDGKGRVLMPGLIDSHADLMALGLSLMGPAAPGARPRPDDRDAALLKAQQYLHERGITAVADMGTTIEAWQTYRRAGDLGRLSLRVVAYAASVEDLVLIAGPGPTPWLYDDRLRLSGLRIAIPKAPPPPVARRPLTVAQHNQAQTAAQAASERQRAIQQKNLLSRAGIDGFQGAVQLADAQEVPALLDTLTELSQTYKGERRWRIELAATPASADLGRLGPMGVALSLRVPPVVQQAASVRYGLGSGAPAALPEPFAAIAASVPREDALAGHTSGAAWAAFADGRFGRLAVGQRADFLLVDRDPLLASAAEVRSIRVLQTWVGGKPVWQAKDAAPAVADPAPAVRERGTSESSVSGGR